MSIAADARGAGRRAARTGRRTRTGSRGVLGGGVFWIVAVGLLLAGVVAINVVVLQLNVELDAYGRERAQLKADIATARAQLSSASANVRIERRAESRLGLVPADPALTTYVKLEPADR